MVDAVGDNLLAEFNCAVDAMQCAIKIQNELKAKNNTLPEDREMWFRIGINCGEIIEVDGRLYGTGTGFKIIPVLF